MHASSLRTTVWASGSIKAPSKPAGTSRMTLDGLRYAACTNLSSYQSWLPWTSWASLSSSKSEKRLRLMRRSHRSGDRSTSSWPFGWSRSVSATLALSFWRRSGSSGMSSTRQLMCTWWTRTRRSAASSAPYWSSFRTYSSLFTCLSVGLPQTRPPQ